MEQKTDMKQHIEKQKRNDVIDIVKGIAILMVVAGHCGVPLGSFFYLFHVAIFIISAGFCFNEKYVQDSQGMRILFWARLKRLYVPYVIYHLIFTVFHNLFIRFNIYTDNVDFLSSEWSSYGIQKVYEIKDFVRQFLEILLFVGGEQLGGTGWFLELLFCVTMLYAIVAFLLKKVLFKYYDIAFIIFSLIFMILGYVCGKKGIYLPGRIATMFTVMILFTLGGYLRKYFSAFGRIANTLIMLISITILCLCYPYAQINITNNEYTNLPFFLVCSIAGWFAVYAFATELSRCVHIKKFIIYIGQHTIPILFLHFLCFKVVSAIVIVQRGYPKWKLACFPIMDASLWLPYLCVGVGMPILLNYVLEKIMGFIKKTIN